MNKQRGFSLVELLVILGILGLLVGVSIPALTSLSKGADLGSAGKSVTGQLELARQTATARNLWIELRIYETMNRSGKKFYNSLALFSVGEDEDGDGQPDEFRPEGRVVGLPRGVVFMPSGEYSTLISEAPQSGQASIPSTRDANYVAFRFKPDGSVSLEAKPISGSSWTLTLVAEKDVEASVLPADYVRISLSPQIGTTQLSRP
ncbi:MAG: Verru_Chthon cassette protein D [Blastochloris sp.]|nr:Verru_Chthon cassette protein D [Blastochloris sp.]